MPSENIFDFTIIGAGLTGLALSWDLVGKFPNLKVQILEKSRGCGGRLATRGIEDLRFDHGAQFIKKTAASERWIEIWKKADAIHPFHAADKNAFCGREGMTQLAKVLANRLPVIYNNKIIALKPEDGLWTLQNDQGLDYLSKNIVITSPLPQSLEILQNSRLNFHPSLSEIQYSCALVLLIQAEQDFQPTLCYKEEIGGGLFSISPQHLKGTSQGPSWTIVMDANWSKANFEKQESQILSEACDLVIKRMPQLRFKAVHFKKWKYCQPLKRWHRLFENPSPNLFLAGDAFGGPSLLGALRSSQGLFEYLQKR